MKLTQVRAGGVAAGLTIVALLGITAGGSRLLLNVPR